jgi:hypothetical protein
MSEIKDSYTCGFRPSEYSEIRKLLPFAHMTGIRLGPIDTFKDEIVLEIFKSMGKFTGTVIDHVMWGELAVLKLEIPVEIVTILSGLDIYSKVERSGIVYKYFPTEGSQKKEAHITLGKGKSELFEHFPIGTTIEFVEAFIKKEGPYDPEAKHKVIL